MTLIFLCIINRSLHASYPSYYQPVQIQQNQFQYYYPQQHYYRQRVVNYTTVMHVHAQQRQTRLYNCYPGQPQIQDHSRVIQPTIQATHVQPATPENISNAIPVNALPLDGQSSRIGTGQTNHRRNQLETETTPNQAPSLQQNSESILRCLLSCCCRRA